MCKTQFGTLYLLKCILGTVLKMAKMEMLKLRVNSAYTQWNTILNIIIILDKYRIKYVL